MLYEQDDEIINVKRLLETDPKHKDVLKYIDRNIKDLSTDALTQICTIIKRNEEKYTTKKDYVLINLGSLKPESVKDMTTFIIFIKTNQNILAQDELIKSQIKSQYTL